MIQKRLLRTLGDEESFVYLSSIRCFVSLIRRHRSVVLPIILENFSGGMSVAAASEVGLPARVRCRVAEILSFWLRSTLDEASNSTPVIIRACLRVIRWRHEAGTNSDALPSVDECDANSLTFDPRSFKIQIVRINE